MKKNDLKTFTEIAIFASIGYILDLIAGFISGFFPNGGSIGIAIVVVVVMTYRNGLLPGILTGLIMGVLDCIDGSFYAISDAWWKVFFQIGLDYIFGYALVALCYVVKPFLQKKFSLFIIIGTLIGGMGKYLSHFLSGVIFWPEFPSQPLFERIIYSLSYNGSYMIPSIILSMIVVYLLSLKVKTLFNHENRN